MKLLLGLILLASQLTFASDCKLLDNNSAQVSWKAFKTPLKVGVGGKFTNITLEQKKEAFALEASLKGLKFDIDTKSVSTNDEGRDKKIITSFFNNGKVKISGFIKEFKNNKLILSLNFNGKTQDIPMSATLSNNELKANGVIDILDFNGNSILKALNKACSELHEGKTWSDVEIFLELKANKC